MEGAPLTPEDDSDKKELKGKKKKKAESIGSFMVEPKVERAKDQAAEKPESLWQLTERKDRPDNSEVQEVSEVEAPLEELGADEKQFVEREVVQAARAGTPERDLDLEAASPEDLAEAAVEHFRGKIVEAGLDSDAALAETLAELQVEEVESGDTELEPALELPRDFGEEAVPIQRRAETIDTDEAEQTPPPSGGGRTGGPPPGPPFGPPTGYNPNLTPAAAPAVTCVEYVDVSNEAGAALLGGIIGYLIGRRRGRIKTEKRLLPVQKKLEKQVDSLQSQLLVKEAKIRQVATEQARLQGPRVIERLKKTAEQQHRGAPEARQLHGKQQSPERIGHMLVGVEASEAVELEKRPVTKSEFEKRAELAALPVVEKSIQTMNRAELLAVSQKIIVDGSSLRQIYETHLIGERGLRRLVSEHLRGGDIKKALRREIVEREIDFERDPVLRDRASATSADGGAALNTLLEKATVSVTDSEEEVAFFKARAAYEVDQQQLDKKHRRAMDVGLVTTIVVLASLVLVLYLSRH